MMNNLKFVKWEVDDDFSFGEIESFDEDFEKASIVVAHTKNQISLALDKLIGITEAEYKEKTGDDSMNEEKNYEKEMSNLQAMLEEANNRANTLAAQLHEFSEFKSKYDEANQRIVDMESAMKDMESTYAIVQKERDDAMAKLQKMQISAMGKDRFEEIGSSSAKSFFKTDDANFIQIKLGEMSEESYILLKNGAEAMTKLTENTFSDLPKTTDQTHTELEKLTEAEANVEEYSEANLSNVTQLEPENAFAEAMSEVFAIRSKK